MKDRKIISIFMILALVLNFSIFSLIPAYAHPTELNVEYDDCQCAHGEDGINETWYIINPLTINNEGDDNAPDYVPTYAYKHLSEEITTIKYYFEETSKDGLSTWTHKGNEQKITQEEATVRKAALAASMKKWNNVYFYDYIGEGVVNKRKIINVIEGTAEDHNISIYPDPFLGANASVSYIDGTGTSYLDGVWRYTHMHYEEFEMKVNWLAFDTNPDGIDARERTGAHEMGHILGLADIDLRCPGCAETYEAPACYHHDEVLMGYESYPSVNITYRDIAGVAITRGFHNDSNHKWILHSSQTRTSYTYKLICSVCNATRTVDSLEGYSYTNFGDCELDHSVGSGNMMAVASYGTTDYYKCKYCRYVAPFSQNVQQNYTYTYNNSSNHKVQNNVNGLAYYFYAPHNYVNHVCADCGHTNHSYSGPTPNGPTYHKYTCSCGDSYRVPHALTGTGRYRTCLECGYVLDMFSNPGQLSLLPKSTNGSYILPSGVIVLVDADIEAYLNGTLQFYDPDDIPVTE